MNISPLDGEGDRNLNMLGRVLRVFTPVVVDHVQKSTTTFVAWYSQSLDGRIFDETIRTPQKPGFLEPRSSSPSLSDAEVDGIPLARLRLMREQVRTLIHDFFH